MHSRIGMWGCWERLPLHPMCSEALVWHHREPCRWWAGTSPGAGGTGTARFCVTKYFLRSFEDWLFKGHLVPKPPHLPAAGYLRRPGCCVHSGLPDASGGGPCGQGPRVESGWPPEPLQTLVGGGG